MTTFGHLHPCGLVVLKKNWKYADFPNESFINNKSFFTALENTFLQEGIMPKQIPHVEQKKNRKFQINKQAKKKLINASHMIHHLRVNDRLKFLTLTFKEDPKNKNEDIKIFFRRLSDKSKRSKKKSGMMGILENYWWVKENQKRGVQHYHCVLDMPYRPHGVIRDYWRKITGQDVKIVNIQAVYNNNLNILLNYVTKYCTEDPEKKRDVFKSRAFGISNAINKQNLPITNKDLFRKIVKNISKKRLSTENDIIYGEFWDFGYVDYKKPASFYSKIKKDLLYYKKPVKYPENKKRKTSLYNNKA